MATHSTSQVLAPSRMEVSRSNNPLLLEIAEGRVPVPPLCDYREWLHWWRTEGKRPTKTGGDSHTTTGAEESTLWKAMLAELYGEEWKTELKEQKEAERDGPSAQNPLHPTSACGFRLRTGTRSDNASCSRGSSVMTAQR